MPVTRRQFLQLAGIGLASTVTVPPVFGSAPPVLIGLDAEFMDRTSTSDDAILFGTQLAIDDINARGGVLGGRPLQLVTTDNRGVPARGIHNVRYLAALPGMTAFLCGKFSPVVLDQVPEFHASHLPLLNPWAAADAIVDNRRSPNYAFRAGLRDSLAVGCLLDEIARHGLADIGIMLPATAWGRSCLFYAERHLLLHPENRLSIVATEWHRWGGDQQIGEQYLRHAASPAQAILLIANEREGAALVKTMAEQPDGKRLPLFSHWGITGGRFPELCGPALHHVELEVVQSFSFSRAHGPQARHVAQRAMDHFKVDDPLKVPSMTGIGPSYDLVQLLALAIEAAGTTDRLQIRAALEHLPAHNGLVRRYAPAFTPERHETLAAADVLLCSFDKDGRLAPKHRS